MIFVLKANKEKKPFFVEIINLKANFKHPQIIKIKKGFAFLLK